MVVEEKLAPSTKRIVVNFRILPQWKRYVAVVSATLGLSKGEVVESALQMQRDYLIRSGLLKEDA